MKRYIKSSDMIDDEFIPDMTSDQFDQVIFDLKSKVEDKYRRRYKNLQVDLDDISFGKNRVSADVIVYNNNKLIRSGNFSFSAYSSYFDESDFDTHLRRTIYKFVESI